MTITLFLKDVKTPMRLQNVVKSKVTHTLKGEILSLYSRIMMGGEPFYTIALWRLDSFEIED